MNKLKFYLKRIYRLSLNFDKQEELFWRDLKKIHQNAEWRYGVYEKDKYIEASFEISDEQVASFYYMIYDSCFHCRVQFLEDYPIELTTELFILAAHLNNLLNNGIVRVNVNSRYIEYHQKRDLLIPYLYNAETHSQIIRHFDTAKEIYSAFQRLIEEQEAPAIIIADLLNKDKKDDENTE